MARTVILDSKIPTTIFRTPCFTYHTFQYMVSPWAACRRRPPPDFVIVLAGNFQVLPGQLITLGRAVGDFLFHVGKKRFINAAEITIQFSLKLDAALSDLHEIVKGVVKPGGCVHHFHNIFIT